MTRSLLLLSLAAGSLTAPAAAAATEPAIRAITVRPAAPVVGAHGSVRLVIDVIAKGVRGKDGVSVKVEPGTPPAPLLADKAPVLPDPAPDLPPASAPAPVQAPAQPPVQSPAQPPVQPPAEPPAQSPAKPPVQAPARPAVQPPGQPAVQPPAEPPAKSPAQAPAEPPAKSPAQSPAEPPVVAPAEPPAQAPIQPPGMAPARPAVEPPAGSPVGSPAAAAVQPERRHAPGTGPKDGVPAARPVTGPVTSSVTGPVIPPRLVWRLAPAPPARMTGGWQTWRFLPDKRLNRYYAAGTWTITVTAKGSGGTTITEYAAFDLKRETKLTSVTADKAARSNGGVRLRGSLTRVDPRGLTDHGPFGKQPIEILWRPDATSAWEKVGHATTDAAGAFVATVPGRTGGYWRARYPGTSHYATDASKSRQIVQ